MRFSQEPPVVDASRFVCDKFASRNTRSILFSLVSFAAGKVVAASAGEVLVQPKRNISEEVKNRVQSMCTHSRRACIPPVETVRTVVTMQHLLLCPRLAASWLGLKLSTHMFLSFSAWMFENNTSHPIEKLRDAFAPLLSRFVSKDVFVRFHSPLISAVLDYCATNFTSSDVGNP